MGKTQKPVPKRVEADVDGVRVGPVRSPHARCPYCREAVPEGVDAVECPACWTRTHPSCMQEARGAECLICSASVDSAPPTRQHWRKRAALLVCVLLAVLALNSYSAWVSDAGLQQNVSASEVVTSSQEPAPRATSQVTIAQSDGTLAVEVVRNEVNVEPGGLGNDRPPLETQWVLKASDASGLLSEQIIARAPGDRATLAESREVRYSLSWQEAGWSLTLNSKGRYRSRARAFWLGSRFSEPVEPYEITQLDSSRPELLTKSLKHRLARLGLATIEIDRLKTITVDGSYYGAQSTHFVSNRTDVLVVLAPTFETHGDVIARGPILSLAHTMGNLASATWVFADDNAFPRGSLDGPRVYAGPQATMGQASVPGERVGPFFEGRLADLNSPDPRVRDDAVRVFAENTVSAELRTPAVAALRPLLKDPDEMVRGRAAWALGELAGQDAVADLVEALADPNRFVRAQILHTLLKLGPSTLSVPALIEILENKAKIQTTAARALAATGLGRIGGPAAIAALKEALATANRDVDSGADDDKTMTAHFLRKAWAEALEAIAETQ